MPVSTAPQHWTAAFRARVGLVCHMILRASRIVWQASPGLATAHGLLTVAQGILPALLLICTKWVMDGAVMATQSRDRAGTERVMTFVVLWLTLQLLGVIIGALTQLVSGLLRDLVVHHVNMQLMSRASTLDLAHFESAHFYNKLENARREAGYRPGQMLEQMFAMLRSAVTLFSVVGALASLAWWLMPLALAVSLPTLPLRLRHGGRFFALLMGRAPEQRQLAYFNWLLTTDSAFKELRIFGLQGILLERYQRIFAVFYRETRSLLVRYHIAEAALGGLGVIAAGAGYGYIVAQVIVGRLTIGALILYYQAFQQAQGAANGLLSGLGGLHEHALFLANLQELLDLKPDLPVREYPIPLPSPIRRGIIFDHVSFTYPGTTRLVLEDVSFAICPGQSIAIVGANGAGKTTLVKLLTRLYDPSSGRITLDGIDLRDLEPGALRAQIGVIFQDYTRYQLTARENIGFGRIEALDHPGHIERAAAAAGAATMIAALPNGYDTPLGRWFENGQELSTGQWQKLAVARAFARDAQILILDEPAASLDARSESEVFRSFGRLQRDRMTMFISHRFGTVRMADRIIVLEEGRVIEEGDHDQLIQRGSRYAELFDLQAASYR